MDNENLKVLKRLKNKNWNIDLTVIWIGNIARDKNGLLYMYKESCGGVKKLCYVNEHNYDKIEKTNLKNSKGDIIYKAYILDKVYSYSGKIDDEFFHHIRYVGYVVIQYGEMIVDEKNKTVKLSYQEKSMLKFYDMMSQNEEV